MFPNRTRLQTMNLQSVIYEWFDQATVPEDRSDFSVFERQIRLIGDRVLFVSWCQVLDLNFTGRCVTYAVSLSTTSFFDDIPNAIVDASGCKLWSPLIGKRILIKQQFPHLLLEHEYYSLKLDSEDSAHVKVVTCD